MTFLSLSFYIFLIITLVIYYTVPLRQRQYILLLASLIFYGMLVTDITLLGLFAATLLFSYAVARKMQAQQENLAHQGLRKATLSTALIAISLPLVYAKEGAFLSSLLYGSTSFSWIAPIGLSFYTLQIIAYLVDVYRGKVTAEKNICKHLLFFSFFPQIIQGPIPRYEQLSAQLWCGHRFDEKTFTKGLHLILWGFFLKMMITDKAAIVVNTIFGNSAQYTGFYVVLGGVLYAIQLYADFLACTSLARGIAKLFGIDLIRNFNHPYLATSIKDFWGRWHLSLSHWMRDYIYIPLGGNRHGKTRKYFNLLITFIVSGVWHGAGYKYIAWGILHAAYQIIDEISAPLQSKIYQWLRIPDGSVIQISIQRAVTFILVTCALTIFRAESLTIGIQMICSIVTVWNPWAMFGTELFSLGLSAKEFFVLTLAVLLFTKISMAQRQHAISEWILSQHLLLRWSIYLCVIAVILIFGSYGSTFSANDFIYGGF